jgi:two-component system OmpR family response regulator
MLAVMAPTRLLLVDDEDNLRSMLEAALRHSGFDVHPVANGRDAIAAVPTVQPDLIVLDVMLPDLDGFAVCKRLRTAGDRTPVLFLTARDATEDKVRGLTLGGDDYLVKPFSLEELVARITAVLRRTGVDPGAEELRCEDLAMDDDAHLVTKAGREVALSPTEYNLLRYLLVNKGRVVSKAQILDHVWDYDFGGDGGVVETYIGYLRRKLDTSTPRLIQTIRGVGYTLRPSQ